MEGHWESFLKLCLPYLPTFKHQGTSYRYPEVWFLLKGEFPATLGHIPPLQLARPDK